MTLGIRVVALSFTWTTTIEKYQLTKRAREPNNFVLMACQLFFDPPPKDRSENLSKRFKGPFNWIRIEL